MPFRDPVRSLDLFARLDAEVRQRIEEAVDYVGLDAMVRARRARSLPEPDKASVRDRSEFDTRVRGFLQRLEQEVSAGLAPPQRDRIARTPTTGDETARLIAVQVVLAKELPDYWQHFEQVAEAYAGEAEAEPPPSGGERGGLLGRLFGGSPPGGDRP
jgi:hypothetical protein